MASRSFARHLRENYQLALNVMSILSNRLRETTAIVRSMASLDVSRRLIQALLRLSKRQGTATAEGIRLGRLTQQDLASLIGISRESTNRALRALVRKGLIATYQGEIVIRQLAELQRLYGEEAP